MTQHFTGKYIKKYGLLQPLSTTVSKQHEQFVDSLPENTIVECFLETQHDDGTLPQLAKLHVIIKQLANHTGETVENMKLLVKDRDRKSVV